MRTLTDTLLTAQRAAPFAIPKVRVRLRNQRLGTHLPAYTRTYEGDEPTGPHDAHATHAGGLFQLRINPADNKVYRRYTPDATKAGDPLTFGYDTPAATAAFTSPNAKRASKYTLATAMTVRRVYAYVQTATTHNAKAIIYADAAGTPAALLGVSAESSVNSADALHWHPFDFSPPVDLQPGTYWLGIHNSTQPILFLYDTGATNQAAYVGDTYSDGPSDPFGTPVYSNYAHSVYASNLDPDRSWTYFNASARAVAVAGDDGDLIAVHISAGTPYSVYYATSDDGGQTWSAWTDTGMVSDANGQVAVAYKDADNWAIFYTRGSQLYCREYRAGVWQAESSSAFTFTSITGLAATHAIDYNLLIAGLDADSQPGLWASGFGCGFDYDLGVWGAPAPIVTHASTESYEYLYPKLRYIDTWRLAVVQHYTATTERYVQMVSYMAGLPNWLAHNWREPFPQDHSDQYGIALCHSSTHAIKTAPDGIWVDDLTVTTWDVSNDVIELFQEEYPERPRSRVKVVLNNTGNKYGGFDKMGYEIEIGWGYTTASGNEYSNAPHFWVTGWRFISPPWFPLRAFWPQGVLGTLEITAEGVWDLLNRWRTPRPIHWEAGQKTILQMFTHILGKAGIGYSPDSSSPAASNFKPEVTLPAGTSGLAAIKKIRKWVDDVFKQRQAQVVSLYPQPDDEPVYTYNNIYGISHLLFRGRYDTGAWDPNRAEVWGDTVMEQDFEFPQIQQVEDRLSRVTTPNYPDATRAAERAAIELRKGQMLHAKGGWVQVCVNCGQEPYDVVTLTDTTAGINAQTFRVLGITTHYRKLNWFFTQTLQLGEV